MPLLGVFYSANLKNQFQTITASNRLRLLAAKEAINAG
jgi:hypothetical protein